VGMKSEFGSDFSGPSGGSYHLNGLVEGGRYLIYYFGANLCKPTRYSIIYHWLDKADIGYVFLGFKYPN
jgi:hypothetical protein